MIAKIPEFVQKTEENFGIYLIYNGNIQLHYLKKLHLCDKRNSYSKTDNEYAVWVIAGPQPADTTTLISFLDKIREYLSHKYEKAIADSGNGAQYQQGAS